jgi:type IV pilus assembly protein PilC
MTEFTYTVVTANGEKTEGKKQASNKEELVRFLTSKGYTIITLHEEFSFSFKKLASKEIGGLGLAERVLIAKQLSTMISAGIPILQAIGILADQSSKPSLKAKFEDLYKKIESGSTLSKAFEAVGGIFSEVQINLLAAGEKSGNLNEMFIKVAEDLEKSKNLRGKVLGALIYPVIIFVVLILVVGVMILFMVPQIKELYEQFDQEKPLPIVTRILVSIGEKLGNPFVLIGLVVGIISIVISYRVYTSDKRRRVVVDKLKLKVPVFGNLIKKIQLTEFCRLTSMLIKSGIPIIEAIEIVAKAMSNTVYENIIIQAKEEVTKGTAFSLSIAKNNYKDAFPPILLRVIATGEDAGKLDKVLEDMYLFYNDEVEQITSNLTKLMEPFILVIVGGLVAFLAVAIYLPIYQVGNLVPQ